MMPFFIPSNSSLKSITHQSTCSCLFAASACWVNQCVSLPVRLGFVLTYTSLQFLVGELTTTYLGSGSILKVTCYCNFIGFFLGLFVYCLFFSVFLIYFRNLLNAELNMLASFLILLFLLQNTFCDFSWFICLYTICSFLSSLFILGICQILS